MKEFGDFENLPVLDARFFAHARETARPDFELRDADRVLVGHGKCKLPRGFRAQGAVLSLDLLEGGEPRQELAGVARVLIVAESFDCGEHNRPRFPAEVARRSVKEVADRGWRVACMALRCRGG